MNSASDQNKIQQIDPTAVTENSSVNSIGNSASSYQNLTSCPASTNSSILRAALQKPAVTSSSNPPTPTATPTLPASQLNFQVASSGQSTSSKQFQNTFNMTIQSNPYNFNTNNQTDSPFGYTVYQVNTNSFNNTNLQQQQFAGLSQPPPPPIQSVTTPVYNENNYFTSLNNGSNQMIVASPGSSISTSSSPSSSSSSSSSSSLSAGMTYLNRSINTQLSKSKSQLVSQQDQQLFNNNNSSSNINGYSLLGTPLNQPIYQNLNSNLFNNQSPFDPNTNSSRSTNNTLLFAPLTNGANSQNTKPTYYDLNKNIQLQQQSTNTSSTLVGNSCGSQLNHSNLVYDDISSYQDLLTTNNQNNSSKTSISCYYD